LRHCWPLLLVLQVTQHVSNKWTIVTVIDLQDLALPCPSPKT
jgi:hypothetical protein